MILIKYSACMINNVVNYNFLNIQTIVSGTRREQAFLFHVKM